MILMTVTQKFLQDIEKPFEYTYQNIKLGEQLSITFSISRILKKLYSVKMCSDLKKLSEINFCTYSFGYEILSNFT